MNKKIIHVDASMLKRLNCFRFYYRRAILSKTNQVRSNYKQAFGTAIHKFLQDFYTGKPFQECLASATEYYKDYVVDVPDNNVYEFRFMAHLQKTCLEYAKLHVRQQREDGVWKLQDHDFQPFVHKEQVPGGKEKPSLETRFSIPVFENEQWILCLSGTIDMVCKYGGHDLVLVDHKTSATKNKDKFITDFELDIQTMLYSKVFKELNGLDYYPPIVINCLFLKKATQKAEKEGTFDGVELITSPIMSYSNEIMMDFDHFLQGKVGWIVKHLLLDCVEAESDYNYSACHGNYGENCEFFDVCKMPREFHEAALENHFQVFDYNPLKFQE